MRALWEGIKEIEPAVWITIVILCCFGSIITASAVTCAEARYPDGEMRQEWRHCQ